MADTLTAVGLRGSFYFHGDHLRQLRERGNVAVAKAMKGHDVASHGAGNVHPTMVELVEHADWEDGLAALRCWEDQIESDMQAVLGRPPLALSRHHFFTAQHAALAAEKGLPYMFACLPGYDRPMWFAGAVMFPYPDPPNRPAERWLDESLYDNRAFAEDEGKILRWLNEQASRGCDYMTTFACHPARCMVQGWMEEACMVNGRQRDPASLGWIYSVRSRDDEARIRTNFRHFAESLAACSSLEVVGVSDVGRRYSTQPRLIPRGHLASYAERMANSSHPLLDDLYSPAELTAALAEAIGIHQERGCLPDTLERRDVLGPISSPVAGVEQDTVRAEQLAVLAATLKAVVLGDGRLPANLPLGDSLVSISQFLRMAARWYIATYRGDTLASCRNLRVQKYPEYAQKIDNYARWLVHHPYLRPDFTTESIALHLRLQTWTLKPARLTSDISHMESGARTKVPV